MEGNSIKENRSSFREFIGSVATMAGDLSNITAPPFVLDPISVVQVPAYSAENTSSFCAPAKSHDPAERALLTAKLFVSGIRRQCYMGHSQEEGPKKPLNAFLGEVFIAKWEDENGTTQYVGEQVSHHPPVTACHIWNEKYGISDVSFNRTEMTFSGSVHIQSVGLVLKTIKEYDEHYLLPIPDFKITGLLSTLTPQLTGTYYIPCTSGYITKIDFTEKGMFGSKTDKHNFEAHVYHEEKGADSPLYTLKGSWYEGFTIYDNRQDKELEKVQIDADIIDSASKLIVEPLDKQDPWESKKAWKTVIESLKESNMSSVTAGKNALENGQRQMRKDEEANNRNWQPLFFNATTPSKVLEQLAAKIPTADDIRKSLISSEKAWMFDEEKWKSTKKPYHALLRPDNTRTSDEQSHSSAVSSHPSSNSSNYQNNEQHPTRRSEGQPMHQFSGGVDHKIGASEDARQSTEEPDGVQIDIGQSPEKKHIEGITKDTPGPQAAQTGTKEEYHGSGIEGMTLREKSAVEDMLRDQYSTGNDERDHMRRKKKLPPTEPQ